jgi:uncharacterized protein
MSHTSINQSDGNAAAPVTLRRAVLAAVLLAGSWLFSGPAYTQSFDCAKAATPVEHSICNDKKVGELDVELADQLKEERAASPNQQKFILESERRWLAIRDMQCWAEGASGLQVGDCLEATYKSRIAELKALTSIRKENSSVPVSGGRLVGAWEGTVGPDASPLVMVILPDRIYWGCARMPYRVIGQKGDYLFLDVSAATYCRSTNEIYLSLHIRDAAAPAALDVADCDSAGDLYKISRNPDDGSVHCSTFTLDRTSGDPTQQAKDQDLLEFESGCKGHRTLTPKQVALVRALGFDEQARAREILTRHVEVNFARTDGWSPLSMAVEQTNLPMVKALLAAGARRRMPECVGVPDVLKLIPVTPNESPVVGAIRKAILKSGIQNRTR